MGWKWILIVLGGLWLLWLAVVISGSTRKYRRTTKRFGRGWNDDVIRLSKLIHPVIFACHGFEKMISRGEYNAVEAYANMLCGQLGWVRDAHGLIETKDQNWLSLLTALTSFLEIIENALAGFNALEGLPPAKRGEQGQRLVSHLLTTLGAVHELLHRMARFI